MKKKHTYDCPGCDLMDDCVHMASSDIVSWAYHRLLMHDEIARDDYMIRLSRVVKELGDN